MMNLPLDAWVLFERSGTHFGDVEIVSQLPDGTSQDAEKPPKKDQDSEPGDGGRAVTADCNGEGDFAVVRACS